MGRRPPAVLLRRLLRHPRSDAPRSRRVARLLHHLAGAPVVGEAVLELMRDELGGGRATAARRWLLEAGTQLFDAPLSPSA